MKWLGQFFVDLQKAFACITRNLLLSKLRLYGFQGASLLWFQNYLTNRRQKVVVGDEESQRAEIHAGMPEGSILGPFSLAYSSVTYLQY